MIHRLAIGPATDAASLKKLARRLAMTGGFELELESGLSVEQLHEISDRFRAEVEASRESRESFRQSSNASRIVTLVDAELARKVDAERARNGAAETSGERTE